MRHITKLILRRRRLERKESTIGAQTHGALQRTVLIFAYYSYRDPVFQSAVLPYFLNFPGSGELNFILVTFEQEQFRPTRAEIDSISRKLERHNITWYRHTWHSGSFKLLKKAYDFLVGVTSTILLVLKRGVDVLYSEAFPGAILGHHIASITGRPHIVHTFEPHADSTIESGQWRESQWESKLLKYYERRVAESSVALLSATDAYAEVWRDRGCTTPFHRFPSCVDPDKFKFDLESRENLRCQFGISSEQTLIVYMGKLSGMYWDEELGQLFRSFLRHDSSRFRFLVVSLEEREKVRRACGGLRSDTLTIVQAQRLEVPRLLSAADVGVCAVRQRPAKRFCSPIKNGEYWACGLPVMIPEGISDDYLLAQEAGIGIAIPNTSPAGLNLAVERTIQLLESCSASELRAKSAAFARRDRDVKAYQPLLRDLFLEA